MKKRVLSVVAALMLSLPFISGCGLVLGTLGLGGCVSASYNSQTGDIKYMRMGPQNLKDVHLKTPQGAELRIGEQKADPTDILLKGIELGTTLSK